MAAKLDALIDFLTKQVYLGRTHLWIWRHLNDSLVQNLDVAGISPVFFQLTLRAHSHEAFLHLSRLLDRKRRNLRLGALLDCAEEHAGKFEKADSAHVRSSILPELRRRLEELDRRAEPVLKRRNTFLAHLDPRAVADFEAVASESKLTIGELEDFYTEAGEIVNAISRPYRDSQNLMELMGWDDFKRLVELVARGWKAELWDFRRKHGLPLAEDSSDTHS
jgi:hypothetical protein